MFPEICRIGPLTVYSYGLMLVIAFFVSVSLASRQARIIKLNPEFIFNAAFISFISGIIGARLLYILQNFHFYSKNPLEIIMLQHGGLSWFGGLFLGMISGALYLRLKDLPILETLDLVVPYVCLAQAIGRIGCLLNGCCYGRESSFGLYFPVHHKVLFPTQACSSLLLLLIFVILRLLQDRPHRTGAILFSYLLMYSVKRFFIEFLRQDNPIVFRGLTLFQLLSIFVFLFALLGFVFIKEKRILKK
jgi:phosphatidylglycerol:prolipoprotein diacylglycerol transferase